MRRQPLREPGRGDSPAGAFPAEGHQSNRPLRADALRNREIILQTASRCFAERGLAVTLNEIAQEAGVGVGTVYRRFPNKDSLVDALLGPRLATLNEAAARAAECPDPREALQSYLAALFQFRAHDRALMDTLVRARHAQPSVIRETKRLDARVQLLIKQARAAGVVRTGFSAEDIPMLVVMIGAVADSTRRLDPDAWCRYGTILMDGVLFGEEMVGFPPDPADIDQALHLVS
jgi:AcrR family transcriptional regulator